MLKAHLGHVTLYGSAYPNLLSVHEAKREDSLIYSCGCASGLRRKVVK